MLCCQGMSFSFDTTVTIETLKSMPSELLRRTTLLCVFGRLPEAASVMNLWVGSYCDWTKQLALSLLAKNHWHPAMATNGEIRP